MLDIKDFLFGHFFRCDSHANLFGKNSLKPYPDISLKNSIIMVDKDCGVDESLIKYYDKIDYPYVSCIGKDADETYDILCKYPVSCIGEVKCYKHYLNQEGEEHTYKDLSIAKDERFKHMPMFIHVDIINEDSVDIIESILNTNPKRKVVLCHCGINELDNPEYAFKQAVKLQHKYNNLWLEVSWVAYDYIGTDNRKLALIDTDRLLFGTDLTSFDTDIQKTMGYFDYWTKQFNMKNNINNLLNG